MLNREQFLKDTDLQREAVAVEGLGEVLMRELSVGERLDLDRLFPEDMADRDTAVSLGYVALSLCEPDGSQMFARDEILPAVELLKTKAQRTIEQLQKAFLRMNGLTEEAIKEAVGNSTEIPSGGGSSASPEISDTQLPELSAAS